MTSIRDSLEQIINLVDYTRHQCSLTAMVGAAVPEEAFTRAREALEEDRTPSEDYRSALLLLLDQIDFTHDACSPFNMVGACLPTVVIDRVRKVLERT